MTFIKPLFFLVINLLFVDGSLAALMYVVISQPGGDTSFNTTICVFFMMTELFGKFFLLPILFWLIQKYVKNENFKHLAYKFRHSIILKLVALPLVYLLTYLWCVIAITIFFPYSIGEGYNMHEIYWFSGIVNRLFGLYQSYILLYICWFVVDFVKFTAKISNKLVKHFKH